MTAILTVSVFGVIPNHFAGMKADQFWLTPIGAGPFSVKSWEGTGDIHLVKNPYYYRPGLPYVDEILSTLPDSNQRALQFQSGEVDIVSEIIPVEAKRYPKGKLIEAVEHYTDSLLFNANYAPLKDIRIRKAMALAVDYDAIADGLYHGLAIKPTGFLPPNVAQWQPPSKPYYRQDVAAAKSLMQAANANGMQLELMFPPYCNLISQIVQQSLQAIGFVIKLNPVDSGTFVSNLSTGKYQLAIWAYNAGSPTIGDPIGWILATNYFFTNYSLADLQPLANTFYSSMDSNTRRNAVVKIQDLGVMPPFLTGCLSRLHAACFSFCIGVIPPMAILGRSLL